jgi:hypothetical protein
MARESYHDVWVIEPNDTHPESSQVQRLMFHHDQWVEETTVNWADFQGSAAALNALQLPQTLVLVRIPPVIALPGVSRLWCGLQEGPLRTFSLAWQPCHEVLARSLVTMGCSKLVFGHWEGPSTTWEHLVPLQVMDHQAFGSVRAWASAYPSKPAGRWPWFYLALKLYVCGTVAQSCRRIMLGIATGLFAVLLWGVAYTIHQSWLQTHQSSLRQALYKYPPQQPVLPVDWPSWQAQTRKFGSGSKANLQQSRWIWNESGQWQSVHALVKPRKRLPKGCEALAAPWVLCMPPETKAGGRKAGAFGAPAIKPNVMQPNASQDEDTAP